VNDTLLNISLPCNRARRIFPRRRRQLAWRHPRSSRINRLEDHCMAQLFIRSTLCGIDGNRRTACFPRYRHRRRVDDALLTAQSASAGRIEGIWDPNARRR